MKLELSRYSDVMPAQAVLETLQQVMEAAFPSLADAPVTLHLSCDLRDGIDPSSFRKGDSVPNDQVTSTWWLDYPNPTQADGVRRLIAQDVPYLDFTTILVRYTGETSCAEHDFVRDRHSSGSDYRDGRGVCRYCGYQRPGVLAPDESSQLARCSLSRETQYPTVHDWRSPASGKAPMLQGGDRGMVFSRSTGESRRTAFFEAFPKVDGHGTFIRGEGETLRQAEEQAWSQYQAYLACPGHEFSREVRGTHRTDGSGICRHCGLFASSALPPETRCECCGLPTNVTHGDRVLCYTHLFEQVPFEAIIEAEFEAQTGPSNWSFGEVERSEVAVGRFMDSELKKWALQEACQGDATRLEAGERSIEHLARFLERVYVRDHLAVLRGTQAGAEGEAESEEAWPDFESAILPHLTRWFTAARHSGLLDQRLASAVGASETEDVPGLSASDLAAFP
jgi:hypothetical protein